MKLKDLNSMKPTMEEIKAYFKDAEIVKENCHKKEEFNINFDEVRLSKFNNWVQGDRIYYLWSQENGYAKIIKYKEPMYTITKEQILELKDPIVKEWFPNVFETRLEVGKWYKDKYKRLFQVTSLLNYKECLGIGFGCIGGYYGNEHKLPWEINGSEVEATEQEVETALINEAKKRGFKNGVWVKTINGTKKRIKGDLFFYFKENKIMSMFDFDGMNGLIFHNGKWAEIIPTLTQKEAEEKLNVKIV